MNTRLAYVALFVAFVCAGALYFFGVQMREKRRQDYLALTHRVTAGRGTRADYEKLMAFIPERAEREEIRVLFGLPLLRANAIKIEENGNQTESPGESWLYSISPDFSPQEKPPPLIDITDAEKLTGPQMWFVVTFNERGRATARIASVVFPLPKRAP